MYTLGCHVAFANAQTPLRCQLRSDETREIVILSPWQLLHVPEGGILELASAESRPPSCRTASLAPAQSSMETANVAV